MTSTAAQNVLTAGEGTDVWTSVLAAIGSLFGVVDGGTSALAGVAGVDGRTPSATYVYGFDGGSA